MLLVPIERITFSVVWLRLVVGSLVRIYLKTSVNVAPLYDCIFSDWLAKDVLACPMCSSPMMVMMSSNRGNVHLLLGG